MARPTPPGLDEAYAAVLAGQMTVNEAARAHGVNSRSIRARIERAAKKKNNPTKKRRVAAAVGTVLDMKGQPVVTGDGTLSHHVESLDARARVMLREAVDRNLQIAAYKDLEVNGALTAADLVNADPARAAKAASVVAVLTDKCPGILGIGQETGKRGDMPDLTTAAGMAEAEAMLAQLPAPLRKALRK